MNAAAHAAAHDVGQPALQAQGLQLKLGGRWVLDGVSFSLHAGQWAAIVGPNGAGKSSLLNLLAGLCRPDAGSVQLQGQDLRALPPRDRARALAWLPQQGQGGHVGEGGDGGDGEMAVRDVVQLGRLPRHGLFGAPDAADAAAVAAAMAETDSSAHAGRRLGSLSGGERQRALLARALAVQAGVLLLDEPTTHLDAPHQRRLLRGLVARARSGAAVAAVLHDLNLALAADRVLVLDRGRLVADGAPADAALRASLVQVFEHAFSIEPVYPAEGGQGGVPGVPGAAPRWVVVPRL